jgi:disease resistance protein RPM1
LNLRGTEIRKLQKSMERLQNLQTLDDRNTNVRRLPSGISKLLRLRLLYMCFNSDQNSEPSNIPNGIQAPAGIWNIRGLQTLACIEAGKS